MGQRRSTPLPIGSVKSNIGHVEAVSGLAGLLKASLAIEHGLVPRSLFADSPSSSIDFAELNITPITHAQSIAPREDDVIAGVCNYGFGGTNAHVILRGAPKPQVEVRNRPLQRRAPGRRRSCWYRLPRLKR